MLEIAMNAMINDLTIDAMCDDSTEKCMDHRTQISTDIQRA